MHRPKSNFLQQLLLKINATFIKNKCNFFRILVQQKLALLISLIKNLAQHFAERAGNFFTVKKICVFQLETFANGSIEFLL